MTAKQRKIIHVTLIILIPVIFILVIRLSDKGVSDIGTSADNRDKPVESADAYEKTSIRVTFSNTQTSWTVGVSNIIASFENLYPQYDVEYELYNEGEFYEDTLNNLYARDRLGDVVEMVTPLYFEEEDLLYPLPGELLDITGLQSAYDGEKYGIAKNAMLFLILGRISKLKGQDLAVKAFAKVAEKMPGSVMVIVGRNDYEPDLNAKLHKTVEENALTKRVFFTGMVEREEVISFLCQSDIQPPLYRREAV